MTPRRELPSLRSVRSVQAPPSEVDVHIQGIRCFAEEQVGHLGRITLLVGENSTGKSPFLAAISMLSDLLRPDSIDFNRQPFVLGSYHDIATIQANTSGHVLEFSVGISGIPFASTSSGGIH